MKMLLATLMCFPLVCAAEAFTIPGDLWLSPRSGEAVRANPTLRRAMESYLSRPNARLKLHHNNRDETTAQAEELRGWLIALGAEAERITLIQDSPTDTMTLEVLDAR